MKLAAGCRRFYPLGATAYRTGLLLLEGVFQCRLGKKLATIRVDVNLLDKVMSLVGELVLARNQILQFTSTQKDAVFLVTAQRATTRK